MASPSVFMRTPYETSAPVSDVDLDGSGPNKTEFAGDDNPMSQPARDGLRPVFNSMDIGDDQITFTEFLAATINPHAVDTKSSTTFTLLDSNNDGFISLDELRKMYAYKHMKKRPSRLSRRSDSKAMQAMPTMLLVVAAGRCSSSASLDSASIGESADGAERNSLFPVSSLTSWRRQCL